MLREDRRIKKLPECGTTPTVDNIVDKRLFPIQNAVKES